MVLPSSTLRRSWSVRLLIKSSSQDLPSSDKLGLSVLGASPRLGGVTGMVDDLRDIKLIFICEYLLLWFYILLPATVERLFRSEDLMG